MVIIGAGGHGKVVADIAKSNCYEDIIFLDDNKNIKKCGNYDVVGSISDIKKYTEYDFFVAIGNSSIRKRIQDKLENLVTLSPECDNRRKCQHRSRICCNGWRCDKFRYCYR